MKKIIVLIGIFCFATSLFAANPIKDATGKMTAEVFPAVSIGQIASGLGMFEVIDGLKRTFAPSLENQWAFPIQGAEGQTLRLSFVNPVCTDAYAPTLKGDWYEVDGTTDIKIVGLIKDFAKAQVEVFYQLDEIDASGSTVIVGSYTYIMSLSYSYVGI